MAAEERRGKHELVRCFKRICFIKGKFATSEAIDKLLRSKIKVDLFYQ